MKKQALRQPNRPLSINFTDTTLQHAIAAKRRDSRLSAIKEVFTMKNKHIFFKQPAGALVALAMVILGGTGVYAAANWFGGTVNVTSDNSIMTVDLSGCQSDNLPPGIERTTDRSNVKFKVISHPHISETDLQRKLLASCEHQTILALYQKEYGVSASDAGVIKSIDTASQTITIEVAFGGKTFNKIMPLTSSTAVYDKGQVANIAGLKEGDYVMIAFNLQKPELLEGENPYNQAITLKNIFKTQYDLREVKKDAKSLYEAPNNIMPLEQ